MSKISDSFLTALPPQTIAKSTLNSHFGKVQNIGDCRKSAECRKKIMVKTLGPGGAVLISFYILFDKKEETIQTQSGKLVDNIW